MTLDVQTLVDALQAPAIFFRENTVRYFNESAKVLFPALKEGKGMPEDFDAPDSPFRPEANVTPKGILYLFRPQLEERSAGDMAAVSRELRSCLSTLTLAADGLLARVGESQEAERLCEQTNQSLYRLKRLADHTDLLRQMEGRTVGLYREGNLDLAGLCGEVWENTYDIIEEAGATFHLDQRESSLPTRGDDCLLRRMLLNLISNAVKAAGAGGQVGLRVEKQKDRALLTVWDSGSGMEPERLAAVFRPQRRRGLPQPKDGPGMGLRLVREIAVLHGGVILAEARPEGGVRMTVSLPIKPVSREERLHAPALWEEDGVTVALEELSDVLPASVYNRADLES